MNQNVNLDLIPKFAVFGNLYFSQYDVGRTATINLLNGTEAYTIPSGATVKIQATKPSGLGFNESCTFSGNVVTVVSTETMTDEAGRIPCELRIEYNGDVLGTANFLFNVERSPHPEGTTDGTAESVINEITLALESALNDIEDKGDDVIASIPQDYTKLSNTVDEISSGTRNLNTVGIGRYNYNSNSGIVTTNDNYIGLADYLPAEPTTTYTATFFNTSVGTKYVQYLDSNKARLSNETITGNGATFTITTPADTAYIYISSYKSGGIPIASNTHLQVEVGSVSTEYIAPVTAYDSIARDSAIPAIDSLTEELDLETTDGYLQADGSPSPTHTYGEKYTQMIYADRYSKFLLASAYSVSHDQSIICCQYDANRNLIARNVYTSTGLNYSVQINTVSSAKYIAFSYRTYGESNTMSITGIIKVSGNWQSQICDIDSKKAATLGGNPLRFKPCYDHLFLDTNGLGKYIPHESLFHVRLSRSFGFNVIEANIQKTSDDVYVVNHGDNGAFGPYFHHIDGVTDISSTLFSSVTWNWIVDNVRYNSDIVKYRTRPPRLEEFLVECKQQNIIPFVTSTSSSVIEIVTKYMGENNFIAYNGNRTEYHSAMLYHWMRLATKDEIIEYCEFQGKPMIYGMANPTDFTDTELKEISDALHEKGFLLGTSYADNGWYRYSALGFDTLGAQKQINRIENGNICNFNSVLDFNNFTFTNATEANGVLTYSANGTISPNVPASDIGIYAIDLQIDFTGKITVPSIGSYTTSLSVTGGDYPYFMCVPIVNGTPQIVINVDASTIIRDISFKVLKI